MKKALALVLVLALAMMLYACGGNTDSSSASVPPASSVAASVLEGDSGTDAMTPQDTAREYIQMLIDGKYEESEALLSEEMKAQLGTMGGSEAFAQALYAQLGTFQSITSVEDLGAKDDVLLYMVNVTTDVGDLRLQTVIDANGKVAGLQALPAAEDPIVPPEGFAESEVTVDAGSGFPLEGRVVKPEESDTLVPLVILIQGSGATNYDEIVGGNRVFGQIAYGLAERGIATLRYDKRNYAYPEIMAEPDYTVRDEYVEDVLAAVELAKAQQGVDPDRVYFLGHSQGGMLAPMFLSEGADVAGMILFAGTPRSFFDILDDQQAELLEYYERNGQDDMIESYKVMQEEWKKEREALATMTEEEAKQAGTVYQMGAYYMYTLEQYDAIADIKALQKPTLILQGGADYQVYPDKDYQVYLDELTGEPYVEFKLYDGLNHLFMPSKATNIMEAMAEYNAKSQILDEVFDDIAAWIG